MEGYCKQFTGNMTHICTMLHWNFSVFAMHIERLMQQQSTFEYSKMENQ